MYIYIHMCVYVGMCLYMHTRMLKCRKGIVIDPRAQAASSWPS